MRGWLLVALLVGGVLLGGCSGPAGGPLPIASGNPHRPPAGQTHTLRFHVTGPASISALSYAVDGRTHTPASVTLPWTQTAELPARPSAHTWSFDLTLDSGSIALTISLDGQVVADGTAHSDANGSDSSFESRAATSSVSTSVVGNHAHVEGTAGG